MGPDPSPATPAMKDVASGDFGAAWGGISSLQFELPLIWTAARRRGFSLCDVARWMSAGPPPLAGLAGKGRVAGGYEADFFLFAPGQSLVVHPADTPPPHPRPPYPRRAPSL